MSSDIPKKTVAITPTDEKPVPYDYSDEFDALPSKLEKLAVVGNTAELKEALGAELFEGDAKAASEHAELLDQYLEKGKKPASTMKSGGVQLAATGFIKTYGQMLGQAVEEQRAAVKNKLFEIANCGDPRYELKALELLGKTSDIALFTERSEINITHTNSESLENEIKERVKKLLNANVIDVTPLDTRTLDEELGVYGEDEIHDVDDTAGEMDETAGSGADSRDRKRNTEGNTGESDKSNEAEAFSGLEEETPQDD